MILEYMQYGDLHGFLVDNRLRSISQHSITLTCISVVAIYRGNRSTVSADAPPQCVKAT